jgi:hypothetical protein
MLEEMRAARQPAVFLDLEIPVDGPAILVVGNNGEATARAIRFDIDDQLPWDSRENVGSTLNELPAVRDGIPYLAPGRTLRFSLRVLNWTAQTERHGWLNAVIRFKDASGREFESRANINLARYNHVTTDTFQPADRQIAELMREYLWLAHERATRERTTPTLPAWCASCLKPIPHGAKKCHWCGEWASVTSAESGGDSQA